MAGIAPAPHRTCDWSKARTGTARSNARSSSACPTIRCSRARPPPTSPMSPARAAAEAPATVYPAFATHNCRTVATILELAGDDEFEFQKLLGMGDALYDALLAEHPRVTCRIYAPVGSFTDLLPYLVRRLLENGANTSFVHQIADPEVPLETLVADPLAGAARSLRARSAHPAAARPVSGPQQFAGTGSVPTAMSLSDLARSSNRRQPAAHAGRGHFAAGARLQHRAGGRRLRILVARARRSSAQRCSSAPPTCSKHAWSSWCRSSCAKAAALMATRLQKCARPPIFAATTLCRQGAVCRPHAACRSRRRAQRAPPARPRRVRLHQPVELPARHLHRPGRRRARRRQYRHRQAGGADAAHCAFARWRSSTKPASRPTRRSCVVGDGANASARALVADPRIAGVAFTGSVETAKRINARARRARRPDRAADRRDRRRQRHDRRLLRAARAGGRRRGGLGIPERGPALLGAAHPVRRRRLRAARACELLAGALAELKVGDPAEPDTDVGPVIDAAARDALLRHIETLSAAQG